MPSPTLEVRHFSLVTEIAATGSVTRAAERLHLTQSALSHQLREIESRLPMPLFLRLRLALAEGDWRSLWAPGTGVLRLCTQCSTGYHWLPPLLETFHRSYPAVEVQ